MSTRTGDPRLIAQLNDLLGRELGRNEYGKPYFSWRWSEDLFWPAFPTGRKLVNETKVRIPIIGQPAETHDYEEGYDAALDNWENDFGGATGKCKCGEPESSLVHNVYSIQQDPVPEYRSDRQCRKVDTWYVCKWLTPWELITGPGRGHMSITHGDQQSTDKAPPLEVIMTAWNRQFPGAAFPAHGWRIPTDAYLPNGPTDPDWPRSPYQHTVPQLQDTEHFIREVKFQTSRPFDEVERDMILKEDLRDQKGREEFGDVCRDAFMAFLNPAPGTRGRASGGGFLSLPWTKFDRGR